MSVCKSQGPAVRQGVRAAPKSAWLLGSLAALSAACSAVLGLDPPLLDPCSNGCLDATTLLDAGPIPTGDAAGTVDASAPAEAAAVDATPPGPIVGVRCGGGSSPIIGCSGATPACCEVTSDAGAMAFVCSAGPSDCEGDGGYPILCATDNDCAGSDVCCHYSTSIKCEKENVCGNPTGSIVCQPDGSADQCPTGATCNVAFIVNGTSLPYFGCSP
jgi:hypothetical protein